MQKKKKKVKSDPFEKGQRWWRDSEWSLVGKNDLNTLAGKEKESRALLIWVNILPRYGKELIQSRVVHITHFLKGKFQLAIKPRKCEAMAVY